MTTKPNPTFLNFSRQFADELKSISCNESYLENGFEVSLLSDELQKQFTDYARHLELNSYETAVFLICVNRSLFDSDFALIDIASTDEKEQEPVTIKSLIDIVSGNNRFKADYILGCFQLSKNLLAGKFLTLFTNDPSWPFIYNKVSPTPFALDKFVFANSNRPTFGPEFPVRLINTTQEWDNLVLNPATQKNLAEILNWLEYRNMVFNDKSLSRSVKNGYRVLFHGPSGTGKSLTASLLGKKAGLEVYCIDLSLVVSKYIGETEKNLESVFKILEDEDCILFFDEADALFGKRTSVSTAHDRYANQEVSYLLQRVEDFKGLTILASNFKGNIDQAFNRRFNNIIHFAIPGKEERLKLWAFNEPDSIKFKPGLDIRTFADRYELTGSNIVNSIHHAFLRSLSLKKDVIEHEDIFEGIRKEYTKMERSLPS